MITHKKSIISKCLLDKNKIGLFVDSQALLEVMPNRQKPLSGRSKPAKKGAICPIFQPLKGGGLVGPADFVLAAAVSWSFPTDRGMLPCLPFLYAGHCFLALSERHFKHCINMHQELLIQPWNCHLTIPSENPQPGQMTLECIVLAYVGGILNGILFLIADPTINNRE